MSTSRLGGKGTDGKGGRSLGRRRSGSGTRFAFAVLWLTAAVLAQNTVDEFVALDRVEPALRLERSHLDVLVAMTPPARTSIAADSPRLAELEARVREYLDGYPWKPFHQTLGISGYQVFFDHPDGMFHVLSSALPWLSDDLGDRTIRFLDDRMKDYPPYALEGFSLREGRDRENYIVPEELRGPGRGQAASLFGVYSFWAYRHFSGRHQITDEEWARVKERVETLLNEDYAFKIEGPISANDEAQRLNGDLAGLIGFIRMAQWRDETPLVERASSKALELLNLRINLERTNPRFVLPTRSASKRLHVYKLARYTDLVPETGAALRMWSGGLAAERLKAAREAAQGWWMTFGDRLIGGENYTNPAEFSRALFAGAALVEHVDGETLQQWIDVPWCKADPYYIEKVTLALSAKR